MESCQCKDRANPLKGAQIPLPGIEDNQLGNRVARGVPLVALPVTEVSEYCHWQEGTCGECLKSRAFKMVIN